jgi:hypothetical protein
MPRLWWALTQDELPRPNGGLSKRIKYYILCLAYARSSGDALRGLKSSLVIGQKAQLGPNPFTPRGRTDLVV